MLVAGVSTHFAAVKTPRPFSKRHGSILRNFPEFFPRIYLGKPHNSLIPKGKVRLACKGTPSADIPAVLNLELKKLTRKGTMSASFDILRRHNDGSLIWVEAASELSHAKDRLQQLNAATPGEYFVFDQKSQQIVARIASS
jgi:hypothetical protein